MQLDDSKNTQELEIELKKIWKDIPEEFCDFQVDDDISDDFILGSGPKREQKETTIPKEQDKDDIINSNENEYARIYANYDIEITLSGNPIIDKYLDILIKIQDIFDYSGTMKKTIKNIGSYFKSEITSNELVANADGMTIYTIYWAINKVLNYKDTRYYIALPVDMFLNTGIGHYVIACKIEEFFVGCPTATVIGPDDYYYGFRDIKQHIEIDGNFSQIPNGTQISRLDYLKIIRRYPNIVEHLINLMKNDFKFSEQYVNKNNDEMRQLAIERLQMMLDNTEKYNNDSVLSQEIIDNITYIQPIEYLTKEKISKGMFGTFEELLTITYEPQQSLYQEQSCSVLSKKLNLSKNTENK